MGQHAVHSPAFLQWWFTSRLLSSTHPIFLAHFEGTVLYTWWLRALGAHIGRSITIDAGAVITDPARLRIGDNASVGRATLSASCVRNGLLTIGTVCVEEEAVVGPRAVLLPNSTVAPHAVVPPQVRAANTTS